MTFTTASVPFECGCLTRLFSDESLSYSRYDHNFSCQVMSNRLSLVQADNRKALFSSNMVELFSVLFFLHLYTLH